MPRRSSSRPAGSQSCTMHDWKPRALRSAASPRNMLPLVSAHGRNAIGLACCTDPEACTTLCETSRFAASAARRALIRGRAPSRGAGSQLLDAGMFAHGKYEEFCRSPPCRRVRNAPRARTKGADAPAHSGSIRPESVQGSSGSCSQSEASSSPSSEKSESSPPPLDQLFERSVALCCSRAADPGGALGGARAAGGLASTGAGPAGAWLPVGFSRAAGCGRLATPRKPILDTWISTALMTGTSGE
mmetsp:Transcript_5389/g.22807  ORF Transcript_5389/g.22807 Transcript_5389/m.22807 type:complete len:245 (-) Transcript_5389:2149-2883(-)